MKPCIYSYTVPGGSHWSLRLRRGISMQITDLEGNSNLAMLFYNPENLLERYNAPDTLKCQHTFKLTQGHCLYSDMGRIFCAITQDTCGWHETASGNSHAQFVSERWGRRNYQTDRNDWHQNGHDAFLVELAKYGLGARDLSANVNFFSKVAIDEKGNMQKQEAHSKPGDQVTLRFEMDTLVILHTCPHPLSQAQEYPKNPILIELFASDPVDIGTDQCANSCSENRRGYENNRLYYLGA